MILLKTRKIIRPGLEENLIVLCDRKLIGKTLDKEVGFFVEPNFFKGEEKGINEILDALKNSTIINALGKESIKLLLDNNIISKENVINIGKTPHVQVFHV